MTLRVEDGTGVRNANAYATVSYGIEYLRSRGRTPSISIAEIIRGTDYIEKRYSTRFRGRREFTELDAVPADTTLIFPSLPVEDQTITIGPITFTFKDSGNVVDATDVGITAAADMSEDAIYTAILATLATFVVKIEDEVSTVVSSAAVQNTRPATLLLLHATPGVTGNGVPVQGTVAGATLPYFSGGLSAGPQALSFPREDITDHEGIAISGVPELIKQACIEYATRAQSVTELLPDAGSQTGVIRRREQVGPILEEVQYASPLVGTQLTSYPAADELLKPLLRSGGHRVIRN